MAIKAKKKAVKHAAPKKKVPPPPTSPPARGKPAAEVPPIKPPRNEATDLPSPPPAPAAKGKAQLELPMTVEQEKVLKTTSVPADAKVMRYHNSHQWSSVIMWVTYRTAIVEVSGKKGGVQQQVPDAIHMIGMAEDSALAYKKLRPADALHFAEIQGGYPLVPGIEYFRRYADEKGASTQVRELLGLSKAAPVKMVQQEVRDDNGVPTGEVKSVPKAPKGGNSNKPAPNADLDELYVRAARLLGAKEKDLRAKYSHLNNGLQAMNLRNRLKAKGHNT